VNSKGISVYDADDNLVSVFDENGSIHKAKETFTGGIEIPLIDVLGEPAGKLTIDHSGVVIHDAEGELVSGFSQALSIHTAPETFTDISIPLKDGGLVTVNSKGISVYDADDNLVSVFDENGSIHKAKETFTGGSDGKLTIDKSGVFIYDAEGELVSGFNQRMSTHTTPETFSQIFVPLENGGNIKISSQGFLVYDKDANLVSSFDENGSNHNSPETFMGGINVPGGITFGASGAFTDSSLGGSAKVGIESSGFSVYDSDGNPLAWFSSDGSISSTVVNADTIYAGKIYAEAVDPLVMESFPVSPLEDYEPGDVLVIDPKGSGSVRLCDEANDTGVVGIVGPGAVVDRHGEILAVMLGAHGPLREDGTRLEAYVKVDASYGAIQAGDLLTTSPTLGYAMKADDPRLGSILGKAMEPLAEGQGLVKVYVTLQ
jgi:DNA-binding beta-propeller fold protein YncE